MFEYCKENYFMYEHFELYLMGLVLFRAIISSHDLKYIFRCDRGKLYIKRWSSASLTLNLDGCVYLGQD